MSEDYDPIGEDPADAVPAGPKRRDRNKPKDSGGHWQTQQAKSDARIIEELKAEAAPVPDPLNRANKANPFDVNRYRRSQSFAELASGAKYLDQIPIGRPHPDRWYRAHPSEEYALEVRLYQPSKGDKKELVAHPYLVVESDPEFVQAIFKYTRKYALYYMVDKDGDVFCWPIVLANERTGSWHESPHSAIGQAERAKKEWVQITRDNGVYVSEPAPGKCSEPKYHEVGGERFLKLVFRSHVLERFDHPTVIDLLGRWQNTAEEDE